MRLSIIIPVFNEQKTVREILRQVNGVELRKGISKEIIVVDDASEDNSKLEIRKAKLQFNIKNLKLLEHKVNEGKGAAVRTAIKNSSGDVILIQDADLEYNPQDYPKLLDPILTKKAEVVYGTRLKNYPLRVFGKKRTPLVTHYLGNKMLSLFTRVLYGTSLSDMETCYKVFTKEVLRNFKLSAKGFDLEPELTAKILRSGCKIYEVPIKVDPRGYDEGKKITWKDGIHAVWTLIKYRFVD